MPIDDSTTNEICGARKDGAVCKRAVGHEGPHCSMPELIEVRRDEFAIVSAELEAE